ncbi:Phytochrome-like protein cph2 [compost metagenome]
MGIRTEEKRAALQIGIGVVGMLVALLFASEIGDMGMPGDIMTTLQLMAGLFCGAISFAIFTQGWILFADKLSRQRLYSAALFSVIGLLDVLHILTLSGIRPFGLEIGLNLSIAFLAVSHFICAAGMSIIFFLPDRQVSGQHKMAVFAATAVLSTVGISLLYIYQSQLPVILGDGVSLLGGKAVWISTFLLYIVGIAAIVYRRNEENRAASLTMIIAMVFMIMGHALPMNNNLMDDGFILALGEWYMGISYYFVLKGVYRLTIEEPLLGRQAAEARMKHMFYHDDLTGLPNLRRLKQRLGKLLVSHGREGKRIGVAVVNIDRFKAINDSLGYSAGDKLLMEVGGRLSRLCMDRERIFRLGEDEFAMILPEMLDASEVECRAREMLASIDPSVVIDETEYHISLSMGLAVFPDDAVEVDQIIQYSDMAVHYAKEQGEDFARYMDSMKKVTQARVELENDMRKALEREEFFLEFQPQFSLLSGKMVGMEALVRWNHPKRGLITPGEFIPLAEESGLIVPLGEWVLRTACQHNKQWQMDGYDPVCISVNLSMRQFRQYNLADRVDMILKEVGLEPRYLELEVTESMTLDIETAFNQLKGLKRLGVHISIDDFGTGYSSLYYLKSLPIDRLKIDQAFVKEVMMDNNDAAIVSTITTMAKHLKLKVTAEGVESKDQLEFLKLQNCHEGQGYLFSKPVSAKVFESEFLAQRAG